MTNELKQEVEFLRVCLITGCYKSEDVIEWADKRILNDETPKDELIDLSLTKKPQYILSMLAKLAEGSDTFEAIRGMLSVMYNLLKEQHDLVSIFIKGLDQLVVECGYELPDDLSFLIGLDDEYNLAMQGIYGSKEECIDNLLSQLKEFD